MKTKLIPAATAAFLATVSIASPTGAAAKGPDAIPEAELRQTHAGFPGNFATTYENQALHKQGIEAMPHDGNDQPMRLIHSVFPMYPPAARALGIEGLVEVGLNIDTDGSVEDVYILWSSHELLSMACIEAVKQWRFEPVTRNGKPIKITLVQPFPFKLTD